MDQQVVALVDALGPAELALRDFVRPLLSAALIQRIAQLDYGMEIEENSRAIEELLVIKRLPQELPWPPREVLELASYAKPDERPGHVARLFACLILIRADDALQPAATLAALVESAVALGPEATEDAVRYLAWCRLNEPGSWRDDLEARPFLTLGLLLAYLTSPLRKDPQIVAGLTGLVVAEVRAALAKGRSWWLDEPSSTTSATASKEPDGSMAKAVKEMAGSDGYRIWRALVGRCEAFEAIEPLRAWFRDGGGAS